MANPPLHCASLRNSVSVWRSPLTMLVALAIVGVRGIPAAVTIAPAVVSPTAAEQKPSAKAERRTVGLPIFSSDGKHIGKVFATGIDKDNQPVLVAEVERTLGLGPIGVAIPGDLFIAKADRIELTITAGEVASRLGRDR
jgi:PRC-barrel domain protein